MKKCNFHNMTVEFHLENMPCNVHLGNMNLENLFRYRLACLPSVIFGALIVCAVWCSVLYSVNCFDDIRVFLANSELSDNLLGQGKSAWCFAKQTTLDSQNFANSNSSAKRAQDDSS
uniref:Uncharacterized protein n=1 Tax=Glossina pallidipes TaxID=7398 RepID=A0A1B0AH07_GLOPL